MTHLAWCAWLVWYRMRLDNLQDEKKISENRTCLVQNKFNTAIVQITGAHLPSPAVQYWLTKFKTINEIEIIPKLAGLLVLNHHEMISIQYSVCSLSQMADLWVYPAPNAKRRNKSQGELPPLGPAESLHPMQTASASLSIGTVGAATAGWRFRAVRLRPRRLLRSWSWAFGTDRTGGLKSLAKVDLYSNFGWQKMEECTQLIIENM